MASVAPISDMSDALTLYDLSKAGWGSYSTLVELARRDELPVPVFRVGRRYLVSRKAYDELMRRQHDQEQAI